MKRRLEKKIRARMAKHQHESYEVAKRLVLAKERAGKVEFRNTHATLHGARKVLSSDDAKQLHDKVNLIRGQHS